MFPKSLPQASTSFFHVDLVTCVAFDSINHILADTSHGAVLKKKNLNLENQQSIELVMLTMKLHERKKLRVSEKGPGDAESVKW